MLPSRRSFRWLQLVHQKLFESEYGTIAGDSSSMGALCGSIITSDVSNQAQETCKVLNLIDFRQTAVQMLSQLNLLV